MKKPKHTKGPWRLDATNSIHGPGDDPEVTMLAAVRFQGGDNAKGKANALLMAAAPDMLEALEDFIAAGTMECCCGQTPCCGSCTITLAKNAVAKARGKK